MDSKIDALCSYGWSQKEIKHLMIFLKHECHKRLMFDGNRFYIMTYGKERIFTGLLPYLRNIYFNNYDYNDATKEVKSIIRQQRVKNKGTGQKKKTIYDGRIIGDTVHKQLTCYFNNPPGTFSSIYKSIHPWTLNILKAFREWGWVPIISEFPCYDLDIGVASRIDFICADKHHNVIFGELKTGHDGTFMHGNNKMNYIPMWNNSPARQAMLQCTFAMLMATKSFPGIKRKSLCYVVRCSGDTVERYKCPNIELIERIYLHSRGINGKNV